MWNHACCSLNPTDKCQYLWINLPLHYFLLLPFSFQFSCRIKKDTHLLKYIHTHPDNVKTRKSFSILEQFSSFTANSLASVVVKWWRHQHQQPYSSSSNSKAKTWSVWNGFKKFHSLPVVKTRVLSPFGYLSFSLSCSNFKHLFLTLRFSLLFLHLYTEFSTFFLWLYLLLS